MQIQTVSKSKFKAKALEYFRTIQETGQPMVVTHDDKPVIKVIPFKEEDSRVVLKQLFGSVLKYDNPMDPVGLEDWGALK